MDTSTNLTAAHGVRLDGAVGSASASDLLITVFGELMRPTGARAWTQTLVDAMAVVGVEEKATRQAVSRLADKGWLTPERVGRRTRWRLTEWATAVLERGAERIYGLGQRHDPWNGHWLVLLASVPEARRAMRGPLSVRLGWAGFGSLGNGTWICPRIEREHEAARVVRDLGIDGAAMFRCALTDLGDPVELAQRAWQPDELATEYEAFLAARAELPRPTGDAAAAGNLIRLVDAWRGFPLLDPDLPAELLPTGWPGERAAQAFTESRAAWSGPATAWWTTTERHYDSR